VTTTPDQPEQPTATPEASTPDQPVSTPEVKTPDEPVTPSGAAPAPKLVKPPAISDELQSEIDEAMAVLDSEFDNANKPKPGDKHAVKPIGGPAKATFHPRVVQAGREHRSGTVVSVGATDIFIEFGPKEIGVVERKQFTDDTMPSVNDELKVVVDRYDREDSIFVCSLPGRVQKAAWEDLHPGQTVEAVVTGVNKGGLELEISKHRAFMPASQVSFERIEDLSVYVGEKMTCRVQRVDRRGSGNIVLSRRDMLADERKEKAEGLKKTLEIGQTIKGTIRKVMPFGAFVDLGGIDGLVHLTDMAHGAAGHGERVVRRYVKEGDAVEVQILKLDWENNRISLGMKQLQADPFTSVAGEIAEGSDISGRVVRLTDFGAFIEVAPGVEGLAHISELEYRRVGHPSDVLKVDEVVQCRVLKIEAESRKVSLSLKALKEMPKHEARPGGGGRGRGRGGERDDRTVEEIKKETPELRRLREKAKKAKKVEDKSGLGGLGDIGGIGLGGLKF